MVKKKMPTLAAVMMDAAVELRRKTDDSQARDRAVDKAANDLYDGAVAIRALARELKYALTTFEQTCSCKKCGPCRRQSRFSMALKLAGPPAEQGEGEAPGRLVTVRRQAPPLAGG